MATTDERLPVVEVARLIGMSPSTVRGLIRTGQLAGHRPSGAPRGKYVVLESECERYLAALETTGQPVAAAA